MSAIDRESPWPGLAPFTEAQSAIFFGRDAEVKILARRVQGDPLTVLFGQSGLGKSSLLQAGVFPRLRSADYCPVYLRLDHAPGAPPLGEQVKQTILAETARAGQWTKAGFARSGESLWEFFHHRDNRLVSPGGIALSPVLVFDQFEELFTLGGAAHSTGSGSQASGSARQRAVAFMTELAELVENRPPDALVARVEASAAELDALDFGATDYRVVITLREDYLPHLESLKTIMPALMDNRMRLSRMNGVQALEAVVKPGAGLVTDDVARAIVEFVAGARGGSTERLAELDVEPPLLSIICRELNERRKALGQTQISADLVTGNRREILTDFYERSVADLPEAMRTFVEDHLLTKSGFRDNLSLESAFDFPGVTRPLIDTLVNRRLLRIEDRLGVERVELTHDVLAEVIRTTRDTHHQQLAVQQAQARERITRRRMWLARIIAAGLLVGFLGVSWIAWRAIRAEREQTRLRAEAETLRTREAALRREAEAQELTAQRRAYAADMNLVQQALSVDNLGGAQELLNRHRPAPGDEDLRGWEWRYLWQFCRSDAQSVLCRMNSSILSVSPSLDRRWIAVGAQNSGQLSVFNVQSREEVRVPAGVGSVYARFSPREPLLAIAATFDSGTANLKPRVLLWDAESRRTVREWPLEQPCARLTFSDDGQLLATIAVGRSAGSQIAIWRVADGTMLRSFSVAALGTFDFEGFATTGDFRLAAFSGRGGSTTVMDLVSGTVKWDWRGSGERVLSLAFSPDGKIVAVGRGFHDSIITLWDVESGQEVGQLAGHRTSILALVFSADGKTLVSASGDQTLRIWDVETRREKKTLRGHQLEVWSLALMSDNRTLVSGSKDGVVLVWDMTSTRASRALAISPKPILDWRFDPNGRGITTFDAEGVIERWKDETLQESTSLLKVVDPNLRRRWTAFSPRAPLVAMLNERGGIDVWDYEKSNVVALPTNGPVVPLAFLPDGSSLLVTNYDGNIWSRIEIWDAARGLKTREWPIPVLRSSPRGHVSPDGKLAYLSSPVFHGHVLIELTTGRVLSPPLLDVTAQTAAGFSNDLSLMAVASASGATKIFDRADYREVASVRGFLQGVHSAAFSPDNRRLALRSGGFEAVKLWGVPGFDLLLTLPSEGGAGRSDTLFSPAGDVLGAIFGDDLKLHLWRAPSWAEIEKAEAAEAVKVAGKAGQ